MGLWDTARSALSSAISRAISSSKTSSGSSSNPAGTYYADGSFTPASTGSSTSSSGGGGTPLRDYLSTSNSGQSASWSASDPNYVTIGTQSFKVGEIPGTRYDPNTSTHYVTDQAALNKVLGISGATPLQQTNNVPINEYLDALKQAGQPADINATIDQIMARMPSMPSAAPTLSYAEARKRAEDELNPLYDETLENALKAVDESNIRRGFFGQLPGAALSRSTAANLGAKKAQAVGQLSNQLVGQSESGARANQALAQQAWSAHSNALLSALQQGLSQSNLQQNQGLNLLNAILGIKALDQNDRKLQSEEERAWLPWLIGGQ